MPLNIQGLPIPTEPDLSEEHQGSVDPLGTLSYAEKLSDLLLPGFTGRMWRARFLTFSAVTTLVAESALKHMKTGEDKYLETRLAFERLFVSAIVTMEHINPIEYSNASRNLPGRDLAEAARKVNDPLSRNNFLKGQAVNGPFGVIARLVRRLEVIDDEGHPGKNARELIMAWADDEGLDGILDDDMTGKAPGSRWLKDIVRVVSGYINSGKYSGIGNSKWESIARHLRTDRPGKNERRIILKLLLSDQYRGRMLKMLEKQKHLFFHATDEGDRGATERTLINKGLTPLLKKEPIDHFIKGIITVIDVYESISTLFQEAFESLIWGLKQRGGHTKQDVLLSMPGLNHHLSVICSKITKNVPEIKKAIDIINSLGSIDSLLFKTPLEQIHNEALSVNGSIERLANVVVSRHSKVQNDKSKSVWIESGIKWTLIPGSDRVSTDDLPNYHGKYLHPYKIYNAYSFLKDLKKV